MKVSVILSLLLSIFLFFGCNIDPYDQLAFVGDLNGRIPIEPQLPIGDTLYAYSDSVYFELDTLFDLERIDQEYLDLFTIDQVSLDTFYINAGSNISDFKSIRVYFYLDSIADTVLVAEMDTIKSTQKNNLPLRVPNPAELRDLLLYQTDSSIAVDSLPNMAIQFVYRDLRLNGNSAYDLSLFSRFRILGTLD
jgi:hypothetical protein